jgi:hypothetical protein
MEKAAPWLPPRLRVFAEPFFVKVRWGEWSVRCLTRLLEFLTELIGWFRDRWRSREMEVEEIVEDFVMIEGSDFNSNEILGGELMSGLEAETTSGSWYFNPEIPEDEPAEEQQKEDPSVDSWNFVTSGPAAIFYWLRRARRRARNLRQKGQTLASMSRNEVIREAAKDTFLVLASVAVETVIPMAVSSYGPVPFLVHLPFAASLDVLENMLRVMAGEEPLSALMIVRTAVKVAVSIGIVPWWIPPILHVAYDLGLLAKIYIPAWRDAPFAIEQVPDFIHTPASLISEPVQRTKIVLDEETIKEIQNAIVFKGTETKPCRELVELMIEDLSSREKPRETLTLAEGGDTAVTRSLDGPAGFLLAHKVRVPTKEKSKERNKKQAAQADLLHAAKRYVIEKLKNCGSELSEPVSYGEIYSSFTAIQKHRYKKAFEKMIEEGLYRLKNSGMPKANETLQYREITDTSSHTHYAVPMFDPFNKGKLVWVKGRLVVMVDTRVIALEIPFARMILKFAKNVTEQRALYIGRYIMLYASAGMDKISSDGEPIWGLQGDDLTIQDDRRAADYDFKSFDTCVGGLIFAILCEIMREAFRVPQAVLDAILAVNVRAKKMTYEFSYKPRQGFLVDEIGTFTTVEDTLRMVMSLVDRCYLHSGTGMTSVIAYLVQLLISACAHIRGVDPLKDPSGFRSMIRALGFELTGQIVGRDSPRGCYPVFLKHVQFQCYPGCAGWKYDPALIIKAFNWSVDFAAKYTLPVVLKTWCSQFAYADDPFFGFWLKQIERLYPEVEPSEELRQILWSTYHSSSIPGVCTHDVDWWAYCSYLGISPEEVEDFQERVRLSPLRPEVSRETLAALSDGSYGTLWGRL